MPQLNSVFPRPDNKELSGNLSEESCPLVTIVTVVYNGRDSIEETICSVVNQSYSNFEYIVIDGGSTDGTVELIKKYKNLIHYWTSEPDSGIYSAMNKGIHASNGEWLVFMNSGDKFASNDALERCSTYFHSADVVYSDTLFKFKRKTKLFYCSLDSMRIIHQSVVYKKKLHKEVGIDYLVKSGFTTSDYLFFAAIAHYSWKKLNEPISIYSPYGVSASSMTYRNKIAINYLFRLDNMFGLLFKTTLQPVYSYIKRKVLRLLGTY